MAPPPKPITKQTESEQEELPAMMTYEELMAKARADLVALRARLLAEASEE